MRFFSRDWASRMDDHDVERVIVDYEAHLSALQGSVGAKIKSFGTSRPLSLHDGLLDHLLITTATRSICLSLAIGDLQVGYAILQLSYRGAEVVCPDAELLRTIFQTRNVEIHYDEFDVGPSQDSLTSCFYHRLSLLPEEFGEIVIRFDDFDFSTTSMSQRGYASFGETLEIEAHPPEAE